MKILARMAWTATAVPLLLISPAPGSGASDWPGYSRDPSSQRYSPLRQINPANVAKLKLAWQYGADAGVVDNQPDNR